MVVRMADGSLAALDFREEAPGRATRDMYLDARGELTDRSLYGPLAAAVPVSVMGMWQAHRRFGRLAWASLVAPAVELAETGFELDSATAASFLQAALKRILLSGQYPHAARFGEHFHGRVGDRFVQADLGATLRRIAEHGPDGFYSGETARLFG